MDKGERIKQIASIMQSNITANVDFDGDTIEYVDKGDFLKVAQQVFKLISSKKMVCECKSDWMVPIRINVVECSKCGQEY